MEAWKPLFVLLVTNLLVLPGDSVPHAEYQADDWSVSHIMEEELKQYVKPYTGVLVDTITSSGLWKVFGTTINGVQGAVNYVGEFMHAYYNDHLRAPVNETKVWIKEKTSPAVDTIEGIFKKYWS